MGRFTRQYYIQHPYESFAGIMRRGVNANDNSVLDETETYFMSREWAKSEAQ